MTRTTVVTACDSNFAWGALLLAASMRMNQMPEPILVGLSGCGAHWFERLGKVDGMQILDIKASDRRCVTCLKPSMMLRPEVRTPCVTWVDCDGIFIGNCSDLILPANPGELLVRKYNPPPSDFSRSNLETWRRDVNERPSPRLSTRVNGALLSLHLAHRKFLERWRDQMEKVLPCDVGIVMRKGSAYFQTDESVLGSLLCFAHEAPAVSEGYGADGSLDPRRYYAHFAYNPKPWRMWNPRSVRWARETLAVVDWLLARKIVAPADLPFPLRRKFLPISTRLSPFALTYTRLQKLGRRLLRS